MIRMFVVVAVSGLLVRGLVPQHPTSAAAPPADTAGVRRAVLDYVEGFYEGDSAKMVRSIHPTVAKHGYGWNRDSSRYVRYDMAWPSFLESAREIRQSGERPPPGAAKEVVVLDVLDQTASARLRALWGIDYLLLARIDGRWMITHVLWQSPPR